MSGSAIEEKAPSILGGTIRVVAAVALVAVSAATWLSGTTLDGAGKTRLASAWSRGSEDPLTTGSIAHGASITRLDPCTMIAVPSRAR